MGDDAFYAFLCGSPLTSGSTKSYRSYCRAVRGELAVDLDVADLSIAGIEALRARLEARARAPGLKAHTVGKLVSGVQMYARFRIGQSGSEVLASPATSGASRSARLEDAAPVVPARPSFLREAGVAQLLAWHGQIVDELRDRAILRTSNGPAGDYAEHLFVTAFNWRIEAASRSGYDATDADGQRYQIKARRPGRRNPSRQLGALRRLSDRNFDVLAAVLFDDAYRVERAILLPVDTILERARHHAHTNSWRFMLENKVWELEGARDVTDHLRRAASQLG